MKALPLNQTDIRFGRWLVIANGLVPAALLLSDAWRHQLGANPANFAIRSTGYLALVSIIASLCITPIAKISAQPWLGNFRRALGLYAFWYALAHFTLFFWLDRQLSVKSTLSEMWLRKYLLVGISGLLLMIPLAVTSTNAAIRRLGPKRWKRLHRLAYLAAIAGVLHYYMLQKADVRWPIYYAIALGLLFLYRIVRHELDLRLAVKRAADIKPQAKPKFWKGALRLAETFDETPHVRTFRFVGPGADGMLPFDFKAGQYLNLSLVIDGKHVNRSYTIASAPTRTGLCEITVKREHMGTSSVHLHDMIRVGDTISVSAPAGKFVFDPAAHGSVLLLAGGVGITPLMSTLRYLTDTAWPGRIDFIFVARTEEDIIFRGELESLAKRHHNVHLTITLTQASDAWQGQRGRLSREMLETAAPYLKSQPIHLCGPEPMIDATRELLRSMQVRDDHVFIESFDTPKSAATDIAADAPAADGIEQQLTFSTTGKTLTIAPDQTILDAAEENGVSINFDCRSGICGTCKIRLASGDVTMAVQDALSEGDKMNNIILACQAKCASDVEVEA